MFGAAKPLIIILKTSHFYAIEIIPTYDFNFMIK